MGVSGSKNGAPVPYKAIFCGDILLHRRCIGFLYMVGTSNQSVPVALPLRSPLVISHSHGPVASS